MVMEPAKIARRYCTRLLVVDLLAVLPCIWAFFTAGTSFEPPLFVQAGGCRMIKIVRVLDPHFRGKSIPRFIHLAGERLSIRLHGQDHYNFSFSFHAIEGGLELLQMSAFFFIVVHGEHTLRRMPSVSVVSTVSRVTPFVARRLCLSCG